MYYIRPRRPRAFLSTRAGLRNAQEACGGGDGGSGGSSNDGGAGDILCGRDQSGGGGGDGGSEGSVRACGFHRAQRPRVLSHQSKRARSCARTCTRACGSRGGRARPPAAPVASRAASRVHPAHAGAVEPPRGVGGGGRGGALPSRAGRCRRRRHERQHRQRRRRGARRGTVPSNYRRRKRRRRRRRRRRSQGCGWRVLAHQQGLPDVYPRAAAHPARARDTLAPPPSVHRSPRSPGWLRHGRRTKCATRQRRCRGVQEARGDDG